MDKVIFRVLSTPQGKGNRLPKVDVYKHESWAIRQALKLKRQGRDTKVETVNLITREKEVIPESDWQTNNEE
jgi:hypothetical protein